MSDFFGAALTNIIQSIGPSMAQMLDESPGNEIVDMQTHTVRTTGGMAPELDRLLVACGLRRGRGSTTAIVEQVERHRMGGVPTIPMVVVAGYAARDLREQLHRRGLLDACEVHVIGRYTGPAIGRGDRGMQGPHGPVFIDPTAIDALADEFRSLVVNRQPDMIPERLLRKAQDRLDEARVEAIGLRARLQVAQETIAELAPDAHLRTGLEPGMVRRVMVDLAEGPDYTVIHPIPNEETMAP